MQLTTAAAQPQTLSMDDGFLTVLQQSPSWQIHSVFANTLNLSAAALPLLTLSNQQHDSLPLSIMTAGIDYGVFHDRIGLAITHSHTELSLGAQLTLPFDGVWQRSHYLPAPTGPQSLPSPTDLTAMAMTLWQALRQQATLGSFFTSPSRSRFEQGLSQFLRQQAHALNMALQQGRASAIEAATLGLLGLGVGLTPSGDDYLVGLLAGLRLSQPTSAATQALIDSITQHAQQQTNAISAQCLHCACGHHYKSSLLALCHSLSQQQASAASQHLALLLTTGSTSGTDIACGLIASLLPFCFEKDVL